MVKQEQHDALAGQAVKLAVRVTALENENRELRDALRATAALASAALDYGPSASGGICA